MRWSGKTNRLANPISIQGEKQMWRQLYYYTVSISENIFGLKA